MATGEANPMAARTATTQTSEIRIAHSPDSDDAFMFYALANGQAARAGNEIDYVLSDIETLNQAAQEENTT